MPKENLAMLNNSRISLTPTDLSRRSEHTGVSVPDDGQEITIHTNRRRRNDDAASTLTAASQTSLLIEYFEKGKRKDGVPSSRPSVRVKVTPSSKRHSKASRDTASSTARASSPKGRRPSITGHKTAPVADAGDRLTLGGDRPDAKNRSRSFSGDISSNLSPEDDDNRYREPEVIVKTKKGRTSSSTKYGDTLTPKVAGRKARSRSTSRDHQDGTNPKLTRRRSRSLSQDRISSKLKEKMDKLGVEYTTKKTKNVDEDPKRKSSRSRTREKKNEAKAINKISENPQYNPALLEAVEDTIKRLILPQLADLKTNQNRANFDKTLAAATAKVHASMLSLEDPNGLKSASMPDISKSTVASPAAEADKSKGQGYMAAGGQVTTQGVSRALEHSDSETSYTRAPGLGPTRTRTGESIHSATSDKTEGVLLGPMHDHDQQQRLRMPMPLEYAESTYAETRASILTEPEGLPYPTAAQANAMPGQTTPPRSRGNSISSLGDSYGGHKLIREPDSVLSPSTLHPEDANQRRPGSSSSIESVSHASVRSLQQVQMAQAKPIHVTSPSSLSIPSISDTPSTKVARQRRKGKAREGVHAIGEEDYDDDKEYNPSDLLNSDVAPPAKNSMDWYFSEQQQQQKQAQQQLLQQQLGLQPQHLQVQAQQEQQQQHQQQQDRDLGSLQQNNNNSNQTQQNKQQTLLNIAAAAGLDRPGKDHLQSRDGSALSAHDDRDLSDMHSEKTNPPFLSPNALPDHHNPIPDVNGMYPDDDVLTNPSEIGRRRDEMDHDDGHNWDQHHDNQHDDQRSLDDYNHDRDIDHDRDHHDMHRGLDIDDKMDRGMDGSSAVKDEGYASPGFSSPGPVAMPMPMGGIDDLLDGDDYSLPYQRGTHSRVASGGSHGMASPLYDSSTGRGVDRIQSKDIVALMDHLTVRDAQRNARDTEILITLVRSAAEMRNSFEDLKKQLEQAQNEIVHQVDMNTERSVQKVLVGPRPQPISAPRPKRSLASEAGTPDDEEAGKRKSMFKRALKGLSRRSATDLTRIEGLLERLLDEVEGLKGGGEFYQQSILGTIENLKHSPPNTANNGLDAPSSSTANSGYYTATATGASASNGPSRQASGLKIYEDVRNPHRISTIEEDSATPTPQQQQQAQPQPRSLPDSPVQNFTTKNDKSAKQAGNPGHPQDHYLDTNGPQSPGVPPSSRGTDAPVNQATIRTSLEVKHPQPKTVYRHTLEQQAQQFINMDPAYNHSSPSLVRFTSQSDANGIPLSPTSEMYTASNVDSQLPPPRPPKIPEEYEGDESPLPLKERKSKERNKDKTDRKSRDKEDKDKEQRRRERRERKERREKENGGERSHRSSKTKLKDDKDYFESEFGRSEVESPSTTTRSMSKLKGPRPLSRNDTNEYKTELENSGTVIRKSRNRSSHMTTDTFGMGGLLD